jgi:hypothetical protein
MDWWPLSRQETIAALPALSAAVALLAASATIWFSTRTLGLALQGQKLNMVTTELKYFEDIRKWGDQLADALTEAAHLCDLDPAKLDRAAGYEGESFFDRRHRLRITISSMIDRGRWFFPNIEISGHGMGNEIGYRGYRHEVLDGVVQAYLYLGRIDYRNRGNNVSLRDKLTDCKRHFVGQLQQILDPTSRSDVFNDLRTEMDKARKRAPAGART